jgi:TonB-dependent starch-binding outer membrane protein SusC
MSLLRITRIGTLCLVVAPVLLVACGSGRGTAAGPEPERLDGRASATTTISADDIAQHHTTRMEQVLQMHASGVHVTNRGGEISVRIRGAASLSGFTEPLFVVDGRPVHPSNNSATLRSLNPKDVERIEVLKDGAAALYGSRGANGVIIITTKRGQ